MARDLRFAVGIPRGDGPAWLNCPRHEDNSPSLAVYADHGFSFCCREWFSPEAILELTGKLFEDLRELSDAEAEALSRRREVHLPDASLVETWHQNLVDKRSPVARRRDWLKARGLRYTTILRHRLGHTGRYFTIPVWGRGNRLLSVKQRRDDDYCDADAPKYVAPAGQLPLVYRPGGGEGRYTAICEGEFDALLLSQYGVDAITSTGGAGSLPAVFAGWRFPRGAFYLGDQDMAGEQAYLNLVPVVKGRLTRVRWAGAKDVTDCLMGLGEAERLTTMSRWFSQKG